MHGKAGRADSDHPCQHRWLGNSRNHGQRRFRPEACFPIGKIARAGGACRRAALPCEKVAPATIPSLLKSPGGVTMKTLFCRFSSDVFALRISDNLKWSRSIMAAMSAFSTPPA
jgi:hypothetical protein